MAAHKTTDPDEWVDCPFDDAHRVPAGRLQRHIMKCEKQHPNSGLVHCHMDYCHVVPKSELRYHILNCPTRYILERDIYSGTAEGDEAAKHGHFAKINYDDNGWDDDEGENTANAGANQFGQPDRIHQGHVAQGATAYDRAQIRDRENHAHNISVPSMKKKVLTSEDYANPSVLAKHKTNTQHKDYRMRPASRTPDRTFKDNASVASYSSNTSGFSNGSDYVSAGSVATTHSNSPILFNKGRGRGHIHNQHTEPGNGSLQGFNGDNHLSNDDRSRSSSPFDVLSHKESRKVTQRLPNSIPNILSSSNHGTSQFETASSSSNNDNVISGLTQTHRVAVPRDVLSTSGVGRGLSANPAVGHNSSVGANPYRTNSIILSAGRGRGRGVLARDPKEEERKRQIRKWSKKLRGVEELEARRKNGAVLNNEELDKLTKKAEIKMKLKQCFTADFEDLVEDDFELKEEISSSKEFEEHKVDEVWD